MGLRNDLLNVYLEAARVGGTTLNEPTDTMKMEAELTAKAIVKFITSADFTITELKAPVVLEGFKIPPQKGDVLGTVATAGGPGDNGATVNSTVTSGGGGVLNHKIDIGKNGGGLESFGYTFIGEDPNSEGSFDVTDEDGKRYHTTVKLLPEDIEKLI